MSTHRGFSCSKRVMARNPPGVPAPEHEQCPRPTTQRHLTIRARWFIIYGYELHNVTCAVQASIRVSELCNLHSSSAMPEVTQPRNIHYASMRNKKYTMEVMERVY